MMLKKIQIKIAIPIPFALSLLEIAANIAKDTKTKVNKMPAIIKENPVSMEEYNKIGKPQPTKKAEICENESPRKIPLQILFLGIG